MVLVRGHVRDGRGSTNTDNKLIPGVVVTQGSGWSTTTDGSGYFSTSANIELHEVTFDATGYQKSTITIPVFSTAYDEEGVISGSITKDSENAAVSGYIVVTDGSKVFYSGAMVGRTFCMRNGVYDGYSGEITENTMNTVTVAGYWYESGGTSELRMFGTDMDTSGTEVPTVWKSLDGGDSWTCVTSTAVWGSGVGFCHTDHTRWVPRSVTVNGDDVFLYSTSSKNHPSLDTVWHSDDKGDTWTRVGDESTFGLVREGCGIVRGQSGNTFLFGGLDHYGQVYPAGTDMNDVWRMTDPGSISSWTRVAEHADWGVRYNHMCISDGSGYAMYVMGGIRTDIGSYTDVWRSTTQGTSWVLMASGLTNILSWTFTSEYQYGKRHAFVLSGGEVIIVNVFIHEYDEDPPTTTTIWASTDNGATWGCKFSGSLCNNRFVPYVVSDDTVYLMETNYTSESTHYVYHISEDKGTTWTTVSSATSYLNCGMFPALVVFKPEVASGVIVMHPHSGDVYNIGGISGDPSQNMMVTLWKNRSYGGGSGMK